jgi:hypothetical protein
MRIPPTWLISLALLAAAAPAAGADEACGGFKWDVSKERALFGGDALALPAGKDTKSAPTVATDHLYELQLVPQDQAAFSVTPGKGSPPDSSFAGIAAFKVPTPGSYRISVDAPLWIDVVEDGKLKRARDYEGQHDCRAPHKIVVFDLDANVPLTLQFSAAPSAKVRLTITRASLE